MNGSTWWARNTNASLQHPMSCEAAASGTPILPCLRCAEAGFRPALHPDIRKLAVAASVTVHSLCLSDMAGQSEHDDNEQNQSQAAARPVTPASAVAPGGERTDQCKYQYDNENGRKHGVASFLCTLPGNNAEGCARFQVRVAYLDRESAAISRAMSLWILTLL